MYWDYYVSIQDFSFLKILNKEVELRIFSKDRMIVFWFWFLQKDIFGDNDEQFYSLVKLGWGLCEV